MINNSTSKYYYKLRRECIGAYGGRCKCCGESTFEFLTIDHINGGGRNHRVQEGGGSNYLRTLRKMGFPKGYRVLCYNCNNAVRHGICPHKRKTYEI